jgi:hypothetical protein
VPRVKLTQDAPEGGPGMLVLVSRSRAQDLVNAGLATRTLESPKKPASKKSS